MPPTKTNVPARRPRIGLALGGGGARGIAHLLVLEALDELGIVPDHISGTSIGAIYGAGYASGLPAKLLRAHTEEVLGSRVDLVRQLFAARAAPASTFLKFVPIRTSLFDAIQLMDLLLPSKVARDFSALTTPLQIVATDFYAQEQRVFSSGPLRPAVAASMALPAIFSPVVVDGRAMVDGGLVNPLPFDLVSDKTDITIAIDVSGASSGDIEITAGAQPSALEVLMASSQIFQRSIVREKLRSAHPDVYIDCPVSNFTILDFHRYKDVLAAAAPVKDLVKRRLGLILDSHAAETLPAHLETPALPSPRGGKARKSLAKAKALLPRSRKGKG